MDILLPWRKRGWDGKKHRAKLRIEYFTTQLDKGFEVLNKCRKIISEQKETNFRKQLANKSLRKCRGHKKVAIYNNVGRCSICKGYKYD